jgi:hypothetical protein
MLLKDNNAASVKERFFFDQSTPLFSETDIVAMLGTEFTYL